MFRPRAGMHPVVVMLPSSRGRDLRIIGLILAVPVAATIRLVLSHYYSETVRD